MIAARRLALAAGICLLAPAPAAAARATAGGVQRTVMLLAPRSARAQPRLAAAIRARIEPRRPITGEHTVLPVLAQQRDVAGRTWLRVRLPGRALGGVPPPASGWIDAASTRLSDTPWHVVIDRRLRRVSVYERGLLVRTDKAVVGRPATPTPRGEYFIEENIRLPAARVGAPFALATSARSAVLQEFDGGPGQIALHGLGNIGGTLGTAASHGCVRLGRSAISWLAERLGPGVPLSIR
ncbi:MAG: hypothetical protein NVS1B9_01890 [Solirubrobacteraceae bacterium]